jgi:outer membrane protein assembly factor BamB
MPNPAGERFICRLPATNGILPSQATLVRTAATKEVAMTRLPLTSLNLALTVTLIFTSQAPAADWSQWRGPQRNGISEEKGLLQEWPQEGPTLLWQKEELGDGYSTPAVAGGRLYVLGNKGLDNEFVQALDANDGSPLWPAPTTIGKVGNPDQNPPYPGARSTPIVDGSTLYVLGSDGDLLSLDAETGKSNWKKNLRADFGGKPGKWAYAESPLVDGDVLVCTPGGSQATIVALNKKSGDTIWQSAIPGGEDAAYSSVVIFNAAGVKQYVQFLGKGVVGVDAKTGELLWRYDRTATGSPANIPTPLAFDDYVYTASGRGGGGLIRIKREGNALVPEEIYFDSNLPKAIGGTVRVGDYIYGASDALQCIELLSGDVKWKDRSVGAASIVYADGNLYLHGENGEVALVEATPEAYREKGRFTPPGQPDRGKSKAWAYPAVANGKLYIFDWGTLWCYDVRASGS